MSALAGSYVGRADVDPPRPAAFGAAPKIFPRSSSSSSHIISSRPSIPTPIPEGKLALWHERANLLVASLRAAMEERPSWSSRPVSSRSVGVTAQPPSGFDRGVAGIALACSEVSLGAVSVPGL